MFVVSSFYSVLACNDDTHFPWKSIWWTKVPLRELFFVWSAALEKILTVDNEVAYHCGRWVLYVQEKCGVCGLFSPLSNDSWIIDLGASDHMTSISSMFFSYNICFSFRIADSSLNV
jgi:hypothetical protein